MGRDPRDYDELDGTREDGRGRGRDAGRPSDPSRGRPARDARQPGERANGAPSRNGPPSDPRDARGQRAPASGNGNGLIRRPLPPSGDERDQTSRRPSAPRNDAPRGNGRQREDQTNYGESVYGSAYGSAYGPAARGGGGSRGNSNPRAGSGGRNQNSGQNQRRSIGQRARELSQTLSRQLSQAARGAERGVRRAAEAAARDFQPPRVAMSAEALAEVPPSRFRRSRIRLRARKWRIQRQPPNPLAYFIAFGAVATLVALLFGGAGAGGLYAMSYYQQSLPQIQAVAAKLQAGTDTIIYDRNGIPLYEYSDHGEHNFYVSLNQINPLLQKATIDTEDHSFYSNFGVDVQGTVRAVLADAAAGGAAQGASTITQQLVKNIVLDDTNKALTRKLNEAILAVGVTLNYTKPQILEMYLNSIDYGRQNQGIEAAAENFFNLKQTKNTNGTMTAANMQLDLAQAALLAGLPNNPTRFDPTVYSAKCKSAPCDPSKWDDPCLETAAQIPVVGCTPNPDYDWTSEGHEWLDYVRTGVVLDHMKTYGDITDTQETAAKAEVLKMLENETIQDYAARASANSVVANKLAPSFVDYVQGILVKDFNVDLNALPHMGLRVYTTLDYPLEQEAESRLDYYINQTHTNNWYCQGETGIPDPGGTPCTEPALSVKANAHNGAVVAIDPHTGDILTMAGTVKYGDPNPQVRGYVNMATAERSMGSTTKGVVYATAFQMGWYPGIMLQDVPMCFPVDAGKDPTTNKPAITNPAAPACAGWYSPTNYDNNSFSGPAPIRVMLANSLNIAATETMAFDGDGSSLQASAPFLTMAQRLGIDSLQASQMGPATALGAQDISLLQLTGAYATFANQGVRAPARAILKITDSHDTTLWQAPNPQTSQVLSPEAAYELTAVLDQNAARIPDFNIYNPLNFDKELHDASLPGIQIAAKTGTSQGDKGPNDIVTEGYSRYLAVGVWVGNTDGNDSLYSNIIGITGAGYIFHDVIQWAAKHYNWPANSPFPVPSDMALGQFNCTTGLAPYKGTSVASCPLKGIQIGPTSNGPSYTDLYAGFLQNGTTGHWDAPDIDWYVKGQVPLGS